MHRSTETAERPWHVWIDTGGTFTDCLAVAPDGTLHRAKVLSNSALRGRLAARLAPNRVRLELSASLPSGFHVGAAFRFLGKDHPPCHVVQHASPHEIVTDQALPDVPRGTAFQLTFEEEAPILATRLVTGTLGGARLPFVYLRLATTKGTNALLEHRGGRTALLTTHGFGDLLEISTQQRCDLFALHVQKPEALHSHVVEVRERLAPDGSVLASLDRMRVERDARALVDAGVECAAVALLHSYANPSHEVQVAEILRDVGVAHVSCSALLAPMIKLLPRAQTAVVDAYLSPVLRGYFDGVCGALGDGMVHAMTSAGGLVRAGDFRPKDSLLSGPAGGVVGAMVAGHACGYRRLISFDMGGTSTDVARIGSDLEYVFEHTVGDAHLVAPAVAVESVAAGGGSLCCYDGHRLRVGPRSAGAQPGPACYGAGGPLTITDVNVLLGRLDPDAFGIPIAVEASKEALRHVLQAMLDGSARPMATERLLEGFLHIANERMADAIRQISIRQGYDPADHVLVAFGGAGGQSACAVASLLGMRDVIIPPDAGLLSAMGLGHSCLERFAHRQIVQPLHQVEQRLPSWLASLAEGARRELLNEGAARNDLIVRRQIAELRFAGQESTLAIDVTRPDELLGAFLDAYENRYGYRPAGATVELVSIRVAVSTRRNLETLAERAPVTAYRASEQSRRDACFAGRWVATNAYGREALEPGATLDGPALVFEGHGTTVVEPDWTLVVHETRALILEHRGGRR